MVNNSTNINKTCNYLSLQTIERKKDHGIWRWESLPWFGTKYILSE